MNRIYLITHPSHFTDEEAICNTLFQEGLQTLHLRKPNFSEREYERFIQHIDSRFRDRIVIHDYFHLVTTYGLKGIHLSSQKQKNFVRQAEHKQVSASCHSFKEIHELPFHVDYCFLSPIFDSISKEGYKKAFHDEEITSELQRITTPVIALGGVSSKNARKVKQLGFSGSAILGAIWGNTTFSEILGSWNDLKTPKVLSIAGFDPSSGAGLTADLKTMEAIGSYGISVCSAITFQNEDEFNGVKWVSWDNMRKQLDVLLQKHHPEVVKTGIVENFQTLNQLCDYLLRSNPSIKIIWDPILRASAGYELHSDISEVDTILQKIHVITPNTPEIIHLFGEDISTEHLQEKSKKYNLNILWKGGHNHSDSAEDILITPTSIQRFSVLRSGSEKHGTGCVFSAAMASFLAQGFSLQEACSKAQVYVSTFMQSATGRLGLHGSTNTSKPALSDVKLMYITDYDDKKPLSQQVENVCQGGVKLVQLRIKGASERELLEQAYLLKAICDRHNVLFIVNDNVHIARQVDADGVHLGKEDADPLLARAILGKNKIIGATCNTFEDIQIAHKKNVDYVGVGPFRFTTTKKNLSPVLGMDGYREISTMMKKQHIHLPVYAIGGITQEDVPELLACGVHGVAVSSYIKNNKNIETKTKQLIKSLYF